MNILKLNNLNNFQIIFLLFQMVYAYLFISFYNIIFIFKKFLLIIKILYIILL